MATDYVSIVIPESPGERALVGRIYAAAARELLAGLNEPGADAVVSAPNDVLNSTSEGPFDGPDGQANLREYIGELQHSQGARRFLRQVAVDCIDHGVSRARSVRHELGEVGAPVLAGWIAAIVGASRRRHWPKPYSQQWANGPQGGENVYQMPKDRARTITQLIDVNGEPTV